MSVVIIDYGSGNLRSAEKAFEHVGGKVLVSPHAEDVLRADRIVLPGVGAFGDCLQGLHALDGMVAALDEAVNQRGVPLMGICVGMQLLASRGLEGGEFDGLGWIDGTVQAITPDDSTLKIPHMGWNNLQIVGNHPVLADLADEAHMYFVHSFHLAAANDNDVLATADYGGRVTAAVGRGNIVGTQFHPEKSQAMGLRLIENFLNWNP